MQIEGTLGPYQNAGAPVNGTNEVQIITPSAVPASGTWKLKFDGLTTTALAHNVTAAAMQTALNLLPSIGAGGVAVALDGGTGIYTITFSGANMAIRALNLITVVESALLDAGLAAVTMVPSESVAGVTATALGAAAGAILVDTTNKVVYVNVGTAAAPNWDAFLPSTVAGRMQLTAVPASYLLPVFGIGVYGTPVVETSLEDNIAFEVNMSTATNKTAEDTSSMAAYIGIRNTAHVANNKIQGLLVSNSLGFNCFDAYAVQGHLTVGVGGVSTKNANAHITGLSGKVDLDGAVGQGWVSGVLAIIEGAGAVTGLCHVIAAQIEATVGANVVDSILFLGADADVPVGIEVAGAAHVASFVKFNALAGCLSANALVPAAAPDAGTMGADAALKIDIGGTPYYIPLYDTLHA